MKKGTVISIFLFVLGLVFEGVHLLTDLRFFQFKFWILGVVFMIIGFLGIIWFGIVPLMENRARTLGKFKNEKR